VSLNYISPVVVAVKRSVPSDRFAGAQAFGKLSILWRQIVCIAAFAQCV
jgi:hypothetical protein